MLYTHNNTNYKITRYKGKDIVQVLTQIGWRRAVVFPPIDMMEKVR